MNHSGEGNRFSGRPLAILGFHKIGPPSAGGWETWYYISEDTFLGYLRFLQQNDWHVINIKAMLKGLEDPGGLPERTAMLSFDDGYRTLVDYALPCLRQFNYPGVVFVPTDFIGKHNEFDANTSEPQEPICGWDELRELERHGVSVQSHGASHRSFGELGPADLEEELRRSKEVLESGLGKSVEMLAYPYGDGGARPEEVGAALARCGYRAACLYGDGPNSLPIRNPFRLERVAMGPDTDLKFELGG